MSVRPALVVSFAAIALAACGDPSRQGAAKVQLQWSGFAPRCVTLTASSGGESSEQVRLGLPGDSREGSKTVAVYRGEGWGSEVTLTARAFEGVCADGLKVAEVTQTVAIDRGVVEATLTLSASDADSDGFVDDQGQFPGSDCNDGDSNAHPGAVEACNGADDNCDGAIDEGAGTTFYADQDQDGYGTAGASLVACQRPQGYSENANDCDDAVTEVNPGASETCNGVDDNCDGTVDEGLAQSTWYADADQDGHGDMSTAVQACMAPVGHIAQGGDCNDGNASVFPGATEVCNGLDDDCDNVVDDGVDQAFFRDQDMDGAGDSAQVQRGCTAPAGYVGSGGDCDDADSARAPGLAEACDMKDNDCDGQVDEGVKLTFYQDSDADTYGTNTTVQACTQPSGYANRAGDCDDSSAAINPAGTETCNGADDNCDGTIDEGVKLTWYRDQDSDGYGTASTTQQACTRPSGYATAPGDCNDGAAGINPGATETCNNIDDDCDSQVDEGVKSTFFVDGDRDGEGNPSATVQACSAGDGAVSNSNDCDDGNPFRFSTATETCDQLDNDCDASVDDGLTCTSFAWQTPSNSGGGAHDWNAVAPFATNKAYAIGYDSGNTGSGKLRVYDGLARSDDLDGDCAGPLYTGWADVTTDIVYMSRIGDWVTHKTGTGSCGSAVTAQENHSMRGVVGLNTTFGLTIYSASTGGDIHAWVTGGTTSIVVAGTSAIFWDIDGTAPDRLIAVGGDLNTPRRPLIFEARGTQTFSVATLPSGLPGSVLELRAVSVGRDGYAVAVGDQGVVLARTATGAWTQLPKPTGATALTGVKTFGASLVYVVGVTSSGFSLWRWDGSSWTTVPNTNLSSAPRDVNGLTPDDLWIVGDDGLVRHWHP